MKADLTADVEKGGGKLQGGASYHRSGLRSGLRPQRLGPSVDVVICRASHESEQLRTDNGLRSAETTSRGTHLRQSHAHEGGQMKLLKHRLTLFDPCQRFVLLLRLSAERESQPEMFHMNRWVVSCALRALVGRA